MIREKLSFREKFGYGLGDFACSMFWKLFSMYLMFFYTDIFGIPALAVGTMFLVTRLWDAAFDPIIGAISDRVDTRWGKFRPFLIWIAIPFGIAGVLTFSTPHFGLTGKIIYAYVTYSLMMMIYSMINVPYASLLGVMTSNGKERTTLASYRMVLAFAGSLVVLALVNPLVKFFGGNVKASEPLAWQLTIVVFAILAILLFVLTFSWTRERVKPVKEETSLKHDIKDLFKNRPWWILLGSSIAALIFNSVRDGAAIYYFKYYVQNQNLVSIYFVLGQAFNIAGIVFVSPLAHKFGKKSIYMTAMLMATALSIGFYWIGPGSFIMILIFQCLISMSAGCIFPLLWSMYADIADYSEWKTGRRATGLVFSASSMSQKFGWTLGGAVIGWLLAIYGFKANVAQTVEAQNGIKLMLSFFPAIGAVLSAIFIFFYPLNEATLEKVSNDLNIRHKNVQPV